MPTKREPAKRVPTKPAAAKRAPTTNALSLRLEDQLCFALYAASRTVTQAYRPVLNDLALTYPQYLVMLVLWEHGALGVGALGDRLHLDSGTLTPLLKRLEKAGLVVRQRAKLDERAVLIELTARGVDLKQQAISVPAALACKSGLTARQAGELCRQLNALTNFISHEAENQEKHS